LFQLAYVRVKAKAIAKSEPISCLNASYAGAASRQHRKKYTIQAITRCQHTSPQPTCKLQKTTQSRSGGVLGVLRKWERDVNTKFSIAIRRRKVFFFLKIAALHPMRRHNKTLKHLAPCALTKSLPSILTEQYKIYVFLIR
jgi:hypothetical protein